MAISEDIKSALGKGNAIMGFKQTMKNLKVKSLKLVVVATNCPENVKKDIEHHTRLSGTSLERFDGTGKQLGTFCGKPFSIAVLGIKEEKKK